MQRLRSSAEWKLFGVMWRAAPPLAAGWWALVLLRGALPAAFALSMGALVGTVQSGGSLNLPLALVGVSFIGMQALGPVHDTVSSNLGALVTEWLHQKLIRACIDREGLAHLENPALADELSSAREFELGITGPNITICMPNIGSGFASFLGGAFQALLLFGHRWWAPVVVGGAWLSTHKFLAEAAVWRGRRSDEVMEKQRKADYAYRLTVQSPAAKEVRLFGLGRWVIDGFVALRHHLLDLSWEERRLRWRPAQKAIVVIVAANVVFFWSLAMSARTGAVEIGAIVVFAQAAIGASTMAFGEFDWWLRTAAQPVPMVLGIVERMGDVGRLLNGERAAAALPQHEIVFDGVSFAYPSTNRAVLESFDLRIPAGRSVAIVGQNGAGKTTLAKLLCRMYDPDAGAIRVDGVDLREFDIESWRSRIAAVFQDYVRYELPLRDNVAPAGGTDDAIARGLAAARASNLATLDTPLSKAYEGGTDLSGGQWQRVALARAVCQLELGAGIVILDEPTAQLDVRGEAEIFENLLAATSAAGATTILISHRFSTVRRADLICVVEHGQVIEVGTHDELIAAGGRYRTMFDLQASRFADDAADGDGDGEDGLVTLEPVEEAAP